MRHRLFLVLLMFLLLFVSSCSEKGDVADRIRIYDSNVLSIPETTYWKDGKPIEKLEGEDLGSITIKYDPGKVKSDNPGFEFTQVAIYTFDENGEVIELSWMQQLQAQNSLKEDNWICLPFDSIYNNLQINFSKELL